MKSKYLLCLICAALMLTGCSSILSSQKDTDYMQTGETGIISIGNCLEINNTNSSLTLLDNKDVLSSDGLYYAAWVTGNVRPYENSDGDTIDLYDAQLYLLLEEFTGSEKAQANLDTWIDTERSTYEITGEEDIICNGQPYTLLRYNCINEDNPYAHGISAFGICGTTAVCFELTCVEDFEEDPQTILTGFLEDCTYSAE
ncbi:MAG: hypothetical protein K2K54_00530 [Lachnospiraceae bacterium]|nr:hypothetical protein [Lachnospiraceae bacterium]